MPTRRKTILNLTWLGAGGGVQNALSFLQALPHQQSPAQFHVFARRNSELAATATELGFQCTEVSGEALALHRFAWSCRSLFRRGQPCFTFFGPPWPSAVGHLINVCGVAYSNLYYPEIDFWKHYRGLARLRRDLTDRARRRQLSKADYWVFETQTLASRAVRQAGYPPERVGVVRMSPSVLVTPELVTADTAGRFAKEIPNGFRLLFLARAEPNKRIDRAASIAVRLHALTDASFTFVTTMDEEAPYYRYVLRAFRDRGVEKHLCNLGPCPYRDVAALISVCDAVCLFSVLESFSNNFVEAWRMHRPLIATDQDWSREAAGAAAQYVDPENSDVTAARIAEVMLSEDRRRHLVKEGEALLRSYPSAAEKTRCYLQAIETAVGLGFRQPRKCL